MSGREGRSHGDTAHADHHHVDPAQASFTYYLLEPLGPWIINLLQALYFASFFELYPQLCVCACGFGFWIFGFRISDRKIKKFFKCHFKISAIYRDPESRVPRPLVSRRFQEFLRDLHLRKHHDFVGGLVQARPQIAAVFYDNARAALRFLRNRNASHTLARAAIP